MSFIYSDSKRLADAYVEIISKGAGAVAAVSPLAYGWIFYYNSKEYLSAGNQRKIWAGNAPFLITRIDLSLIVLGTIDVGRQIDNYEKTVPPAVMKLDPEPPPEGELRITPRP